MAELITVTKSNATRAQRLKASSMSSLGWTEPRHLESWLVEHIEVLDPDLKVVATQLANWESDDDNATDRLDILALSKSGELVVVELKRGGDRRVHLQALTYAGLVSGFTLDSLASAHAQWLRPRVGHDVSQDAAREAIESHVEQEWDETLLALPRMMLVAEFFPGQVVTTLQWLANAAPDLAIEAHQYTAFDRGEEVDIAFTRVWPVEDLESRILRPRVKERTAQVREQITKNERRRRSVALLHGTKIIPEGSVIELRLTGQANGSILAQVESWLSEDPARREFRWVDDQVNPLTWSASPDPGRRWGLTELRNYIFASAGAKPATASAALAWRYGGRHIAALANQFLASDDSQTDSEDQ